MTSPRNLDWPAATRAVAAALPPARWPERVRTWLAGEAQADEPWCVALSGGADSVAALLALAARRDELTRNVERGVQTGGAPESEGRAGPLGPPRERTAQRSVPTLLALHFNHRLRGAAADGDEAFCRELCAALGVELRVGVADWPAGSEVSEAQARAARFAFFDRAMREVGARALWLGHQRDDVVETMLLRLSRGSGARGLAAPRPVQRMADGMVRLRPLLGFTKTEIVAALRAAGVPWCEDATNHGEGYFRNRLRNQVVPAWAAAAPADLAAAVARSRSLLEEEDEALELWVDRILPADLSPELPLAELRAAPVAVTRRALHRWLGAMALDEVLSRAAFDELLVAVRAGCATRRSAGDDGFLETDNAVLRWVEAAVEPVEWGGGALPIPGGTTLPDGGRIVATVVALDPELRRRICAGEFDDGRTAFLATMETSAALSIRPWRAGDRYRPLGAAGSSKLQDQFVNRRIPRWLRRQLPVVCAADGEILWVPGLAPAHEARVREGTTVALQLTYLPPDSLSAPTGHV